MVEDARNSFRVNVESLQDLKRNSLDEVGREKLKALIQREGFVVTECRSLEYKENENWGTVMCARRLDV
jgi:hypothetical protein